MTLLADIKRSLRVTTDLLDAEVQMLADAALYDMERAGVNPALLELDPSGDLQNAFAKHAVTAYCKAHFGFDNADAGRLDDSYRRVVCDLLNSSQNVAAIEEAANGSAVGPVEEAQAGSAGDAGAQQVGGE